MEAIEFLKVGKDFLKRMSKVDLKRDDYKHIELYEDYVGMRANGVKVDYILAVLSNKYKISDSTIKRIVKRFSQEVR